MYINGISVKLKKCSENVLVEWMKELVSQPVRELICWISISTCGCLADVQLIVCIPHTLSNLQNNMKELVSVRLESPASAGGRHWVFRTPMVFGDTDHYKAVLYVKPHPMCWDSKPLKFIRDKTVSFDLFTKEQVRWKGYRPLKNIPTTFFFYFNVTILPLWRKGFYSSAMSKCSQNQGLRTLTFSLSAGNKTNGQMTAMWFKDYKIYEEAASWGGKWWRHEPEREKQVEDGKRNRNASPWTLGFRNEDVCLHNLSTA